MGRTSQNKRRLEITIKLKAGMILLNRDFLFLFFESGVVGVGEVSVSDVRRGEPGARTVPFLSFPVCVCGGERGVVLGFDGSHKGPDRNAPRFRPPGWLLAGVTSVKGKNKNLEALPQGHLLSPRVGKVLEALRRSNGEVWARVLDWFCWVQTLPELPRDFNLCCEVRAPQGEMTFPS